MTLLDDYATYHRDPRNRLCHEIGIPLIVAGIFAFLERIKLGPADAGGLVAIAVLAYYFRLDKPRAWIATAAFVLLYGIAGVIPWPVALALFLTGWALQFVGHLFEGKKPAFTTNLLHLLVGPLWICGALLPAKKKSLAAKHR